MFFQTALEPQNIPPTLHLGQTNMMHPFFSFNTAGKQINIYNMAQ